MEKLRAFLTTTKKYQFWVLCGATLVISLGCVAVACSQLFKQCSDRKSKLEGEFENVKVLPDQPNQARIDDVTRKDEQLKKIVLDAWKVLYAEQTAKNPFPTDVLGPDCKEWFDKALNDQKVDIPRPYREDYQNYIKNEFPKLQKMIDIRRIKGDPGGERDRAGPGAGLATDANIEYEGLVEWDANDRKNFESRFVWEGEPPSTLAILLAQEDLWVCEALLRVIANCNEGKDKPSTAVVKRIEHLDIGQEAALAWIEAEQLSGGRNPMMPTGPSPAPSGGMSGPGAASAMGGMIKPSMTGQIAGGSPTAGMNEDQIKQHLLAGRYVDDKGMPLLYDAGSPYYVRHPFAEFKLMPIRMSLIMDQRRIPKLLVECANSNMPIEVRRVRIALGGDSTSVGGMAGGQGEDVGPLDIPVEIQAWIYIYNPPDVKNLGTGAASLPANLTTPATTPPTSPRR